MIPSSLITSECQILALNGRFGYNSLTDASCIADVLGKIYDSQQTESFPKKGGVSVTKISHP